MYGKGYLHFVKGIDPVADAFAGTKYSDVYNMAGHDIITFLVLKGVGATGTTKITVEACDDVVPSNQTAIPFRKQEILSGDTHSASANVAATGFDTTAGSSQIYAISVKAENLASTGYGYVRLKMVEQTDSPVVGAVIGILGTPKFDTDVQETVLT